MSDSDDLAGTPTPDSPAKPVRVGKLDTARGIRKELGRLYRATRLKIGHDLTAGAGAKLAYMLNLAGRSLETEELEARIAALEKRLSGKK